MKKLLSKISAVAALGLVMNIATPAFAAETYDVDPVHSSVVFKVKHFGVYNYGLFTDVAGSVTFDEKNVKNSAVDLTIKTDSVYTHVQKRDDHLKSPDFFNSKQFPTITFKSKSVKAKGADSFDVTGDLNLHGVTKSVTASFTRVGKAKGMKGETRSGGEAMFKIKRSDFGMSYLPQVVADDISLIVAIEGIMK